MSWRARAVFVSGTFRDMHEERDLLAAQVFHTLGEKLAEHYTILERVDLRVGVETRGLDDDHAKQELVLKVCLEDVRRCRPFLIVLVGDRYGWVPPPDRARAAVQEVGFRTALEGKSVTALEIEFGLFGDPEQQTRSRIYFRKLDYTGMDEADAIVYSDERAKASALVSAEERPRAAQRAAALADLKQRLCEDPVLGPRCRNYSAGWDPTAKKVTGLGAFIAAVVADLLPEMIEEAKEQVAAAKAGKLPTPLEQFVAERSRGFRGRAGVVGRLCAHATDPGDVAKRGLVVAGASGSGKSAVFARVYEELAKGDDLWLLAHAAGVDPRSTSVVSLLEDWVALLASKVGVENPLAAPARGPDEPRLGAGADKRPKPEEAFADLLAQAAAKKRVVLLLDALDRFERTSQAEQLTWLPERLPANVRLIATAVTGPETEALAQRSDFAVEPLVALTEHEAREIAQSVYDRYHRQPNQDAVRALIEKPGPDGSPAHGSALWLVSALEEMNLLDGDDFRRAEAGKEATNEERLHAMVVAEARAMPGDVEGLYARIFERAGRRVSDDPREGTALARAFAAAIALSRGGLRERDLAALIPGVARLLDPSGPALPWDALAFASLRRALRAHLVRRGEDDRWDFHHRQARSAAERAYLPDARVRKQIHGLVAEHLLGLPGDDPLRESETMYHLIHADAAERAARLYTGELTPGGLVGCREELAKHALDAEGLAWVTGLPEVEALEPDLLVALGERYLFDLDRVFDRMYVVPLRAGVARSTERLFRRLLATNPGNSRLLRDVSVSLNNLGDVKMARGNLDAASAAYAESLKILRGLSDPHQPQSLRDVSISLNNLGQVETARGNLDAASAAFAESLTISRGLSDPHQPQSLRDVSVSLGNVGQVEMARGNLDAASAAYAESLEIARGLSDPRQPLSLRDVSVSLDNVAEVEMARGSLDAASAAYAESLKIRRGLSDPHQPQSLRHVSVSLDNVGRVEMARGNLDAASAAYAESLTIRRGLSDPHQPQSLRDVSVSLEYLGLAKPGTVEVQAWAVVDNTSGEDWNQVKLGVGSSSAMSFRYDLHSVRTVARETLRSNDLFAQAPPTGGSTYGQAGGTAPVLAELNDAVLARDDESERITAAPAAVMKVKTAERVSVRSPKSRHSAQLEALASKDGPPAPGSPLDSRMADVARRLQSTRDQVVVEGFAEANESDKEAASLARANRVREQLIRNGLPAEQVVAVGRGLQAGRAGGVRLVQTPPPPAPQPATPATPAQAQEPIGTAHFESQIAMSVARGSSAMVSILKKDASGEVVYLYDSETSRGNDTFPFKAIRLINPTDSVLEGGPVTVFGEGRFIGEGLVEPIPARSPAFVPFALDRQVVVERKHEERDEIARIITVQRGVFSTEARHIRRTVLSLHNRQGEKVAVYLRHSLLPGYKLTKSPGHSERMGAAYLFRVELEPKGKTDVTLEETTPVFQTTDIRAHDGLELIGAYLSSAAAGILKDQVAHLAKLQKETANIEQQINTTREQMQEYRARMDELHAQIVTLTEVKTGAALLRDLQKKMQDISQKVSQATIQLVNLQERLMISRIHFQDAVAELSLEDKKPEAAASESAPSAPAMEKTAAKPASGHKKTK